MSNCRQELCENWSGDGNVCPCALFGIEPSADVCYNDGPPHPRTECHMDACGLDPIAAGDS